MTDSAERINELLAAGKPLAAECYRLTGKPLGVTGEVAEYVAAQEMDLVLAPPRMAGYDAIRPGRLGRIKPGADCDKVLLVVLDNATLEPVGMWEASYAAVIARLSEPGSTARNERGALSVGDFKRLAKLVWPIPEKAA